MTKDEAFDAWAAEHGEKIIWSGQITGRYHWTGRDPQEIARTTEARILAYDGAHAFDATGYPLDEWQDVQKARGHLIIWGEPAWTPPVVEIPQPPVTVPPEPPVTKPPVTKPPVVKPPSTAPYRAVVTPTGIEAPSAVVWFNTSDGKNDYAVSRRWRSDADGGVGPWPDTDQWLNPNFPGAGSARSPLELRKMVRRLSIHPPIVEACYRAGLWERVPATYKVQGSEWEDDATNDYGDRWITMPPHAQRWASQCCTLGTAIKNYQTLPSAFAALGFNGEEASVWTGKYHCLRVRVRDLNQLSGC